MADQEETLTRWHLEAPHWRRVLTGRPIIRTGELVETDQGPVQTTLAPIMPAELQAANDVNDTQQPAVPEPVVTVLNPGGEAALAIAFGLVGYALAQLTR